MKKYWMLALCTCLFQIGFCRNMNKYLNTCECSTPSNIEGIDCVYVINLHNRLNKWEKCEKVLRTVGIDAIRFEAINGQWLSDKDMKVLAGDFPVRMRKGQVGCLLSHLSVLKSASVKKFKNIWVMEDDIKIVGDIGKIPSLISDIDKIDPNWDILYTDFDTRDSSGKVIVSCGVDDRPGFTHFPRLKCKSKNIKPVTKRFGLYSYLISDRGINKILEFYKNNDIWTAIDIDIHYIPTIRQYRLVEEIVSIDWQSPISDTAY